MEVYNTWIHTLAGRGPTKFKPCSSMTTILLGPKALDPSLVLLPSLRLTQYQCCISTSPLVVALGFSLPLQT